MQKNIIRGLSWSFGSVAIQAVLQILAVSILARLVAPADFGLIGMALIVVSFSQILSSIGIVPALIQREGLNNRHLQTGSLLSLVLGCGMVLLLYFAAGYISHFFGEDRLKDIVRYIAFILPVSALSFVAQALLQRELKFKEIAVISAASYFFGYGLVSVLLAFYGFGVWSLVWGQISQIVIASLMFIAAARCFPLPLFHKKEFLELMNYGSGFSLAKFANFMANQADNVIVGKFLGAAALGIYGRAYQFMIMPANLFGTALDRVMFPVMARLQSDQLALGNMYKAGQGVVAACSLVISGFFILLGPEIVYILLGEEWGETAPVLQVLAAALVFRTGYKLSDSLARAVGAVYRRAWRQYVYAAAVVLGGLAGMRWGVVGVASGVSLAILVNYLLMLELSVSVAQVTRRDIWGVKIKFALLVCLSLAFSHLFVVGVRSWVGDPWKVAVLGSMAYFGIVSAVFYILRNIFSNEIMLVKKLLSGARG